MARFEYRGLGKYLTELAKSCGDAKGVNGIQKMVLFEGARVYADALRTASGEYGNLADGVALTAMQENGGNWSIRLGFYGYDEKGDGKPYALKAAIINSGTSDNRVTGNNFIRKTLKAADPRAQAAMDAKLDEIMNNVFGGN
jgi:hypothetical protein